MRGFPPDELIDRAVDRDAFKQRYNYIKRLEGEILHYMTVLRTADQLDGDALVLGSWTTVVRDAVRSVKAIKNVRHDFERFEQSLEPAVEAHYRQITADLVAVCTEFDELWTSPDADAKFEELVELKQLIEGQYNEQMKAVYATVGTSSLKKGEISTFLNVIRQLHTPNMALLSAVKEFYLTDEQIHIFESLPPETD